MSLAYSSATLLVFLGGCSLVYDTGDLRDGRDGGASADADPDALFVARVTPDSVFEGEGSAFDAADEPMVRAIPIVLEGQNMSDETVFTIEGLGLDGEIDDVVVSGDGHFAAFAMRVPIVEDLADGMDDHLAIHLAKADEETTAPLLVVHGLDPFVRAEGGSINTGELHAMYTHVDLAGTVSATGDAPLRIVATAGINVAGALWADAGNAPTAGAGGCAGGARHADASCGPGSGKAGESSASPGGGGGGGYGSNGTAGSGGDGEAGSRTGQASLVGLPPAEGATAHGAGGGGGGDLTANQGGRGGGSGGVVELATPAVLTMTATAAVSAAGGDGETALCTAGGGGGGGSGGAILLRAGVLMAAAGASAAAPGGMGTGSDSSCRGGNGGDGRIRIDRGNDASIDADTTLFVGPMVVADDLEVIVSDMDPTVTVRGAASEDYQIYVGDQETPKTFETDAGGLGTADVSLEPGLNRLCAYVTAKTELDYPEAKNCVDVAYIKP